VFQGDSVGRIIHEAGEALKPQGPGPERGRNRPVQRKFSTTMGQWQIQRGEGVAVPHWLTIFFKKPQFFRVKGLQSVVCICDK